MKLFDLHCDTLYRGVKENIGLYDKKTAVDFNAPFEAYTQTFAAYIEDETKDGYNDFIKIADYMKNSGIKPAVSRQDLDNCKVALFSVENGAALGYDINNVDNMYNLGVRIITLTWNGKNHLASGCKESGGLTDFGRQVIEKMNGLQMAVDLSHINRKGFFEAVERAKYPIATHSCFYGVVPHIRNLSNEQAMLIAKKGGIIGLCVYPEFLGQGDPFEAVARQIEYGKNIGLENNLAIGTDFDGADMNKKLCCTADMQKLHSFLCNHFGEKELVDNIFYNNAYIYFSKLLTK